MKTVAYLISTLRRTGPTNVLAGIVKNLDTTRFKPVVITLSPETGEENSWYSQLQAQGVRVYSVGLSRRKGLVCGATRLKHLLGQIHPDILHAHCFRSALLAAHFQKAYPALATVHCDWEQDFKLAYGAVCGAGMAYFYKRALGRLQGRVACSKMLADLLNQKHPRLHVDYVDNGVDTDKFYPVADKTALRQELGLPTDKKIILWAGNFLPVKNPLALAHAILQIPPNRYYFIFCGDGPLLAACKELLKNRPDVRFTGYITNIAPYYQAADSYVSTSKSEGLPLAVLEAQFCGLIPLLSDIPQHRYTLPPAQADRCLHNNTVPGLTEKLQALQSPANTALRQACAEHIQRFSAPKMSQKYQERYAYFN